MARAALPQGGLRTAALFDICDPLKEQIICVFGSKRLSDRHPRPRVIDWTDISVSYGLYIYGMSRYGLFRYGLE